MEVLNEMKKETTGDRLKKYRKLRKLTQKDVANFLGVKNNTISNWENNINGIDVKYILPLCQLLEITPSIFVGYEKENLSEIEFENKLAEIDPKNIIDRYYGLPEFAQISVDNTIENLNNVLIAASGAENLTEEQKEENVKIGLEYYKKGHNQE